MLFKRMLLLTIVIACAFWTTAVKADDNQSLQIELSIIARLNVDPSGLFILEGDLFLKGGPLSGHPIGTYECVSIPSIAPNCDPVAAAALGFNAANGVAVFNFEIGGFSLGSITTANTSCVVNTDLSALSIDIVSEGDIVGGTGIFQGVQGDLNSSSTVMLATGDLEVDVTLTIPLDD